MTIHIDDSTLAMWHCEIPRGNFTGALRRTDKPRTFQFDWRFRHYRDDVIGPESKDIRNEYTAELANTTEREAIAVLHDLWAELHEKAGPECGAWELIRGARSAEEFFDQLVSMPSMHARSAEEYGL